MQMDEIDRNADLSRDGKYRQRREAAAQAIADLEVSKTLARAREAAELAVAKYKLEQHVSPEIARDSEATLKAMKELEQGWQRGIDKISERAGRTTGQISSAMGLPPPIAVSVFPLAPSQLSSCQKDVPDGSLADIKAWIRDVRFTPQSRHAHRRPRCLQNAKSGHRQSLLIAPDRQVTNGSTQCGKDSDTVSRKTP
jgi:hypothetical protein